MKMIADLANKKMEWSKELKSFVELEAKKNKPKPEILTIGDTEIWKKLNCNPNSCEKKP